MSDNLQAQPNKRLYIFGKNGTICKSVIQKSGKSSPPNTLDEQDYWPDVADVCFGLRLQGHRLAVVSNEGGVAFGIFSADDANLLVKAAADYIAADAYRVCCNHPKGNTPPYNTDSPNRLPQPGMLVELMHELGFLPSETTFVDDWDTSKRAAELIGCEFIFAHQFFKRVDPFADRLHAAMDIQE